MAGHPSFSDRPSSVEQLLRHEFFLSDEQLLSKIVLPQIPMHIGNTDLMISYSSFQVMHVKRVSALLNMLGISTKDGTQVPQP